MVWLLFLLHYVGTPLAFPFLKTMQITWGRMQTHAHHTQLKSAFYGVCKNFGCYCQGPMPEAHFHQMLVGLLWQGIGLTLPHTHAHMHLNSI